MGYAVLFMVFAIGIAIVVLIGAAAAAGVRKPSEALHERAVARRSSSRTPRASVREDASQLTWPLALEVVEPSSPASSAPRQVASVGILPDLDSRDRESATSSRSAVA